MTKVIRRHKSKLDDKRSFNELSDAEKYQCLQLYTQGKGYKEISESVDMDSRTLKNALSVHIKDMTLVQETKKLGGNQLLLNPTAKTSSQITEEFKELAQEHGLTFGYYLGLTNDSRYALAASGLDQGIHAAATTKTRAYILRIRSLYLQSIPAIKAEIDEVRKKEYTENKIDRPYIISEIVGQLEEEKILREDNPASRQNSIKLIQMLGNTIGAFSTTINVAQINPEDSLQALIDLAEADVVQAGTYQIEDAEDD